MNDVKDVLGKLAEAAAILGYGLDDALFEKLEEMRSRAVMMCRPNREMLEQELTAFVDAISHTDAPDWLLSAASAEFSKRPSFSKEVRTELEDRQTWRCAVCGQPLSRTGGMHIDHVRPISLGGNNDMENLQLLCRDCNLGKGNLISWVLGAPYADARASITKRKRYCVLKRDASLCCVCREGPPSRELTVSLRVAQSSGGKYVMDNLQTLCSEHEKRRNSKLQYRIRKQGVRSPTSRRR
jgi:5-methylcytosine-specific restriction endonuclease McrA